MIVESRASACRTNQGIVESRASSPGRTCEAKVATGIGEGTALAVPNQTYKREALAAEGSQFTKRYSVNRWPSFSFFVRR